MTLWSLVILQAICVLEGKVFRSGIVNGNCCAREDYAHMVILRRNKRPICGGGIIDSNTILTAAHCLRDKSPNNYEIVAGGIQLSGIDGKPYRVKHIIRHTNITCPFTFDIAILKLESAIDIDNKTTAAIELNTETITPGTMCTVSGWGLTSANGTTLSKVLLHTNLRVISEPECEGYHRPDLIKPWHICTEAKDGTGACNGDSGGLLVCEGKAVGVASFVVPCGCGYPDAYANIAYKGYNEWIKANRYL
ncbi:hypothetical protein RI129_005578 [Pyrocoelia pectoralis]|uniref:Peptidase S1 domain-containing protein n=1 Tax=Pyrocoelia pectoralis TaxID=417401 RepID=A0AAN7VN06_9COLE